MSGKPGGTSWSAPDQVRVPSRDDPVVAAASESMGGPLGRYAAPLARGWRYYAAVLAGVSAIPSALSVLLRSHCIEQGWSSPDQFWHACFSDLPATYRDAGLSAGVGAWLTGAADAPHPTQPPLTAFVMTLLGSLVPSGSGSSPDDQLRFYFGLWAVLAAVLLALVTWWTAGSVRRFPIRAAHVALSPVVVLTLMISPDIVGVALLAAAIYAWTRERVVLTGILLGLAISARSYPVLVLAALLFLCLRAGRLGVWARVAGIAAVTFGGIMLVIGVLNPAAAVAAYRGWADLGAGFGSPWLLPQLVLGGATIPGGVVTALAVAGWVAALVVGALFALSRNRRPGLAEVSLVMIGIVMLTGKSMPVQSALWLVPLVALVGLEWRDHLIWAACEALHFEAVWLYLAGTSVANRGLPAGWYAFFLLLRLAGVAWLVGRTWRLATARSVVYDEDGAVADEVLGEQESDPLAGPLHEAPDDLVVRFS